MNIYYAYSDPDNGVEGFPGLSKTDFKADSTLVVDFAWKEMFPRTAFDNLEGNVVDAAKNPFEMDVKEFIGKNLVIAVAYNRDERENPKNKEGGELVNEPKYYFDSMNIENALRNDWFGSRSLLNVWSTLLRHENYEIYLNSYKDKKRSG